MEHLLKLLSHKKQIILQGPPGTGKTYTAKDLAEQLILGELSEDKGLQKERLEASGQFALVQFHPAYTYEDFVRGISARSEGGKIIYETENKVLANFAQRAHQNLVAARKNPDDLSKEELVRGILLRFAERVQVHIDEYGPFVITQAVSIVEVEEDAFRYSGTWKWSQRMKFQDLILAQLSGVKTRQDLQNLAEVSGLAKQHASYYLKVLHKFQEEFGHDLLRTKAKLLPKPERKPFVLVIDEINRANLPAVLGELIFALEYRNEAVESMYALDGDHRIILAENLYLIGTMNTADRSAGHIDYAIKRRFAFVEMLPLPDLIQHAKAKELYQMVARLFVKEERGQKKNSSWLSPDFHWADVHPGHSYFMLDENEKDETLKMRLQYEIIPLLKELVKDGVLMPSAREEIEKIAHFEC